MNAYSHPNRFQQAHTSERAEEDGRGKRALDAYRHMQEAGLSSAERDVLGVRIRHMDLEAPGITWTAPDEMAFLSGRDPKTSRNADRSLVARGIQSVAEPATAYRATRYRLHLDRLAAIAAERVAAFQAQKRPAKRPGRRPKDEVAPDLDAGIDRAAHPASFEIDRAVRPNWPGVTPPELPTPSADISLSVGPSVNAQRSASRVDAGPQPDTHPSAKSKEARGPKQWPDHATGLMIPVAISRATWRSVVNHVTEMNRSPGRQRKALMAWLADACAAARLGHDPNEVLDDAILQGLARPDMDAFEVAHETADRARAAPTRPEPERQPTHEQAREAGEAAQQIAEQIGPDATRALNGSLVRAVQQAILSGAAGYHLVQQAGDALSTPAGAQRLRDDPAGWLAGVRDEAIAWAQETAA